MKKLIVKPGKNSSKVSLSILGILLIAGTVLVTIDSVTKSAEINQLSQEEQQLSLTKKELAEKIVEASSLNNVGTKANELGYSKPQNIVYVGENEGVAVRIP
jgi:hypothetical protein